LWSLILYYEEAGSLKRGYLHKQIIHFGYRTKVKNSWPIRLGTALRQNQDWLTFL
jgi:hypothetical protein